MAIKGNLIIDQGSTFSTTVNVTDDNEAVVNLTGYTGAAQMRKHYTSLNSHSFSVSISPLIGTVTLSMNATTTASITPGRYAYDCELTASNGTKTRLVEGIVTVTPEVTR
jgi:hypothetical protein